MEHGFQERTKMGRFTKAWFVAAIIRAIKTFAQAALSVLSIGVAFQDIDWIGIVSVGGVAAIYSILTSAAIIPEESKSDAVDAISSDTEG